MRELATFWCGRTLGPMERARLNSMTRLGHSVALYSDAPIPGVPQMSPCVTQRESRRRTGFCSIETSANLARHCMPIFFGMRCWKDRRGLGRSGHHRPAVVSIRRQPHRFRIRNFSQECRSLPTAPVADPARPTGILARNMGRGPHIKGARRLKCWVRTLGRGYSSNGPRKVLAPRHSQLSDTPS